MRADIYPLQMLLQTVSGWVHRHQADVIAYLVEENRVLKEQMKGRALRLTDDQRRRLAAKAKLLGRKALTRDEVIIRGAWVRHRDDQTLSPRKRGRAPGASPVQQSDAADAGSKRESRSRPSRRSSDTNGSQRRPSI